MWRQGKNEKKIKPIHKFKETDKNSSDLIDVCVSLQLVEIGFVVASRAFSVIYFQLIMWAPQSSRAYLLRHRLPEIVIARSRRGVMETVIYLFAQSTCSMNECGEELCIQTRSLGIKTWMNFDSPLLVHLWLFFSSCFNRKLLKVRCYATICAFERLPKRFQFLHAQQYKHVFEEQSQFF